MRCVPDRTAHYREIITQGSLVGDAGTLQAVVSVMEAAGAPALKLSVPLQVDAHTADNWDEAH